MHAEEIAESLGLARSNVSNSIKELLGYKIIHRIPIPGDRRDHFEAEADVWQLAMRIAAVRKEKEIDPALETLTQCLAEAKDDKVVSNAQRKRLSNLYEFTHSMDRWYGQMLKVPASVLMKLVRMGDKVVAIAGFGNKNRKDKAA